MVALECKIRVSESELRNHQLQGLRHLRGAAYAELAQGLLYLRAIGIIGAELKRVRFLDKQEVLDAHRRFAGVVHSRRQLEAGIVYIRSGHSWRQRRSWLRSKRILFGLWRLRGLLRGRRSCGRLCPHPAPTGTQKDRGHRYTKSNTGHSVHRFSSEGFFSNIFCIILISARCVLSASVAKLKRSASCPAPAVSNKSFTMVNAPLWC